MTTKRIISILSPSLTHNALGRAYLIAKLLQEKYSVHIVGPGNISDLWVPVRDDNSIEYRPYTCKSLSDLYTLSKTKANNTINGDLIYAIKPLLCSYGLGLIVKNKLKCPLLLDIDDWEIGFLLDKWRWELQVGIKSWVTDIKSPLYTRLLDHMTKLADGITVSNSFLQTKYGGCWIPHARDERMFQNDLKTEFNKQLNVLFLGTPRAHKGLDILLSAWRDVKNPHAILRIVGISKDSDGYDALSSLADARTVFEDPVPFEMMPQILKSASIIVIPQLAERGAIGQLPAKLIDAMASGMPIISTAVGDIPFWLSDKSGIIIPPGNIGALTQAINDLLNDPEKRDQLGIKARERYMSFGSFRVIQPRLVSLIESILGT